MKSRSATILASAAIAAGLVLCPNVSRADESGVSFWLPGLYGSLAATPTAPGWSVAAIYYHTTVSGSGAIAAAREIQVGGFSGNVNTSFNLNLNGRADLMIIAPTYTVAEPILGGQFSFTLAGIYGRSTASLDGTLTTQVGQNIFTRNGSLQDTLTSYGDLYPTFKLKWNAGVHNYMVYGAGDIPVGDYDSKRLANIGIGHGAIDFGGGYTYFNPATGHEFSAVAGATYNFKNPTTQQQSGIDLHLDWGASQFLSKQLFVGLVGYAYQQVTDDFGQPPILGGFRSRVFGVGPQLGYIFPVGELQGFLGIKGYGEFANENRPAGWNTWLTFGISEAAPSTVTATKHLVTK